MQNFERGGEVNYCESLWGGPMLVAGIRSWSRQLLFVTACLAWMLGGSFASQVDPVANVDQRQAVQSGTELELSREWLKAIEYYEHALDKWPENAELKYGLRRSKIHFGIVRRYSDNSFRDSLLGTSRDEALNLFDEVLLKVHTDFVDRMTATSFVAHGTESLYLALRNERFVEKHLSGVDPVQINNLRRILRDQYWNKPISHRTVARHTISQICDIAYSTTGLKPTCVVMEYVFGGCNALDDYSNFLTPDRLGDLYDNIDGEFVGLGIEMKSEMGKGLLLVNVLPESPAAEGGLQPGDYIVSVDGADCKFMTTDEAAGLLRGYAGSQVRVEVASSIGSNTNRFATLTRREVQVKSIPEARIVDKANGVAYIRMTGFQKTTSEELDSVLRKLQGQGMRALIWDVRGNPGGLLVAAVEVLDRFVDSGVLVSTRGRTSDQNWTYSAHRPGTWNLPLVLLTDGNSASASEIVAGAVRDHRRGTIVGRKTFGKWSVQSIYPIQMSTGLRLTTAKFYAPGGQTYGKIGIEPDIFIEEPETNDFARRSVLGKDIENDPDVQRGIEVLRTNLASR